MWNRYTCVPRSLEKHILKLKANKTPPIIDYIRETYHPSNVSEIKEKMFLYPNNHFAIKLSTLGIHYNDGLCFELVDSIIQTAIENKCKVLIDAEEHDIQESVDLMSDHFLERYNGIETNVYKTYQMYKKGSIERLKNDLNKSRDYTLGIKLVRGAYLRKDRDKGVLCNTENETHVQYNQAISDFANYCDPRDKMICATHNVRSVFIARHVMDERQIDNIEFAQLMGMSDYLTNYLQHSGYKVYKYLPYGNLYESIPYLTRRLFENSHMLKYI